ncbi:MAG: transcriptional regulator NrdR [Burkholderiales bacterium]|nr:transcriptional regulator NrdR [Burkholderiales bacterium]
MMCPFCKFPDSQVIDSRSCMEGTAIRRRRRCMNPKCGKRFTTYEKATLNLPLLIKRDGISRVSYNPDKLRKSMEIALRKRPVKASQIDEALESIETKLRFLNEKEVHTSRIGEMVLEELRKIDGVAYMRFASVYLDYKKPEDFVEAINKLKSLSAEEQS